MDLLRAALTRAPFIAAIGLAGCLAESVAPAPERPVPVPVVPPVEVVDVHAGAATPVGLTPPPVAPEAPFRERRRMDLEQLDAALRSVTGGIGWTEVRSGREVNLFEDLASTLGKPDFLQITEEDLEPSAMFQKFLDDAARSACAKLMAEDPTRATAAKTFFVHAEPVTTLAEAPEQVKANLQYLLLRYHGRRVTADAPELEPWLWLMRSAEHVTTDQPTVWRTLCVGLITHPDFYTY
jgi:hypothetical protein